MTADSDATCACVGALMRRPAPECRPATTNRAHSAGGAPGSPACGGDHALRSKLGDRTACMAGRRRNGCAAKRPVGRQARGRGQRCSEASSIARRPPRGIADTVAAGARPPAAHGAARTVAARPAWRSRLASCASFRRPWFAASTASVNPIASAICCTVGRAASQSYPRALPCVASA